MKVVVSLIIFYPVPEVNKTFKDEHYCSSFSLISYPKRLTNILGVYGISYISFEIYNKLSSDAITSHQDFP